MNETTMNFGEWMAALDSFTRQKVGIGVADLPSQTWAAYHAEGLTPEETFDEYIRGELEDLGFHLEIADMFDEANELGMDKLASHCLAEAGLDYVTDGEFDLAVDGDDELF